MKDHAGKHHLRSKMFEDLFDDLIILDER